MSTRIIAAGVHMAAPSLLGVRESLSYWFRSPDALYLFDEGVSDIAYAGNIADYSGNGHTATPRTGGSSPIHRDWGYEAADGNGFAYQTPFSWQDDFTVIIAARQTKGNGPTQGFPSFFGSTQGMGADMTLSNTRNHGVFIDVDVNTGSGETEPIHPGVKSPANFNSGVSRRFMPEDGVTKQSFFAIALSVDQGTGTIRLRGNGTELSLPGETAVCADITSTTGNFCFGIFKGGSVTVVGGMSCCAFFLGQGDMSADEVDFNLAAARRRLTDYDYTVY